MKQQRRGLIWLIGGVILALAAGLLTFSTINDATTAAVKSSIQEGATTQVLVAIVDIPANQIGDSRDGGDQKRACLCGPLAGRHRPGSSGQPHCHRPHPDRFISDPGAVG